MDDITTRLVATADDELRKEIEKAAEPLVRLLRDGVCGVTIKAKRGSSRHDAGKEFDTGGSWPELLEALREDAFRKNAPMWREKKVGEFMSAVRDMQAEIDRIRDQIGGAA